LVALRWCVLLRQNRTVRVMSTMPVRFNT
jgi:hypothetical protein